MLLLILVMSFFIIPHSSSFVNPFSEVFPNFLFRGAPSFETALILYHIQSSLSSTFFKFFQKTFLWPLFRFQTSFSIISHPNSFVNPFSEVFSNLFFRDSSAIFATAFLLYHFLIGLSSTFYLSFWFYQLISDTSPPDFRPSELSCWTNSLTDSRPFVALSSDSFYIIAWILQFVN